MTSRPAVIVIDAARPRLVADFWRAVLGWEVVESDADGISVAPGDGSWPGIDVFQVPEGKSIKNRLHLDLRADGSSTEDELQRRSEERRVGKEWRDGGARWYGSERA